MPRPTKTVLGTTRRKRLRSRTPDRALRQQNRVSTGRLPSADGDPDFSTTTNALDAIAVSELIEADAETYLLTPVTTPVDVRTLAFIMHPSHELASLPTFEESSFEDSDFSGEARVNTPTTIAHACSLMGISREEMQKW